MLDAKNETRWVLLAEDDADIRHILRETIQSESEGLNIEIVEAIDGIDALAKVNSREFHCVLTDVRMPRSSGLELIRAMHQTALNAHTPKLVVTAAPTHELESLAGHIRVVNKPFIATDLARIVVREIRLGRMDERAAVHLINPFTHAIQRIFQNDMNIKSKHEQPSVHKNGDAPIGDIHCVLAIAAGQLRHRFTLSFDKTLLQHLKFTYFQPRTASSATLNSESVAIQLCQLIYEQAIPKLEPVLGASPVLSSTSLCTNGQSAHAQLCNTSGVNVVINTPHGRLVAGAHSKSRPRRV